MHRCREKGLRVKEQIYGNEEKMNGLPRIWDETSPARKEVSIMSTGKDFILVLLVYD